MTDEEILAIKVENMEFRRIIGVQTAEIIQLRAKIDILQANNSREIDREV